MRVERGRTRVFVFFLGQVCLKRRPLLGPFAVVVVEDLGHRAPTDVFDQHGLFLGGRWSFLRIKCAERFDGFEVLLKLLLWSAFAQPIGFGDAVAVEIPGRFFLLVATVAVRFVADC